MNATHEEWRPIEGQEGSYEVSSFGRVRSLTRQIRCKNGAVKVIQGKVLRPFKGDAYEHRVISFGKRNRHYVHLLVLAAFVGPRPEGMEGCHNDGDPYNNHVSNLRWDTPSGNQRDRLVHGTHHLAKRTHCKHGHEYTPENTSYRIRTGPRYVKPSRARYCRTCQRERYAAKRNAA